MAQRAKSTGANWTLRRNWFPLIPPFAVDSNAVIRVHEPHVTVHAPTGRWAAGTCHARHCVGSEISPWINIIKNRG